MTDPLHSLKPAHGQSFVIDFSDKRNQDLIEQLSNLNDDIYNLMYLIAVASNTKGKATIGCRQCCKDGLLMMEDHARLFKELIGEHSK